MKAASTSLHVFWPASLVGAVILFTGCVGVVPLPVSSGKVEHGHRLTRDQVAFVQPAQTTRAEVISQLGTNYVSLHRERAIAYSWEMKGGGGVWWYFIGCTAGGAADGGTWTGGWRAFFIAFDDYGVVTSAAFKSPSTKRSLHEHLEDWVNRLPAQPEVASTQ